MAIKKLQNNFTTPEQSKRLLELGLPVDSVDCYYTWKLDRTIKINVLDNETYSELLEHISQFTIPCWSVGRLIEIYLLAVERNTLRKITMHDCTLVESVLQNFEEIQECIEKGVFDFSKLEE